MPIRHHKDLRAYQLCCALRKEVIPIFARPGFKADLRFREDFMSALDSWPNNIAEGFWRYSHPEFARFVVIARGSVGECLSHLDRARLSHYISDEEYGPRKDQRTPLQVGRTEAERRAGSARTQH